MKIRGRKLKTALSCTLSLLLALSSFGFALAETQTQRYNVPLSAELVPEGYLDFTITAGPITATNSRENPNTLTYSSVVISNNESTDAIEVSSIAYTAPSTQAGAEGGSFTLAPNSTDFATESGKFSMVVSDGTLSWDLGYMPSNAIQMNTKLSAGSSDNEVTFGFTGKVSSVTGDMSHIDFGNITVTVEAVEDYESQAYVLFESIGDGAFYVNIAGPNKPIQYSFNGSDWATVGTADTNYIEVTNGKLYLRAAASGDNMFYNNADPFISSNKTQVKVSGNIMALIDYEKVEKGEDVTLGSMAFYYLFRNCVALTDASDLILPATDVPEYAYAYMFDRSGLMYPPALPMKTVRSDSCYKMFNNCPLREVPLLYVEEFKGQTAFSEMFINTMAYISATPSSRCPYEYRFPVGLDATEPDAKYQNTYRMFAGISEYETSNLPLNQTYYINLPTVAAY